MLKAGQTLGHFQIIKLLGAGGMGEVYLAEDKKLKRRVALKILLSDYFEDSERKSRFEREARTAAGISHPNVTAIYDIGSALDPESGKDLNYIVMELVEGMVLSDYLTSIDGDLKAIIRVSEKIATGLAAAHKMNIVHRDIKTDNIIINENGDPKILDFGLAKPVSPIQSEEGSKNTDTISKELTQAGKIIGTVSYMSPEQIRGESVDSRSDIFSFGILLYRLATGNPPFDGKTQVSTLAKILETQQASPRLTNDKIPPELERIIDKCLQKEADDRYQDTRDLVVDLRNLRRQYDSSITGPISMISDMPERKRKMFEFRLGWKQLTIIVTALITLGGIYWQILPDSKLSQSHKAFAGENTLAILSFENKTGSDEYAWLETGLPEILQTDLAQNKAVTIISRDRIVPCIKEVGKQHIGFGHAHKECLKAANYLGAINSLSGAFYKLGDQLRIDARLEELSTGRIISSAKVIGSDPFALVDSLTRKISASLNISDSLTADVNVSTFTSSSQDAYKKYLEGMEAFEIEIYDKAIERFKEAIGFDSTFALPYMRIGMAHVFEGRQQEGATWFVLAQKYQDKLPVWERSLLDIYVDLWLKKNYDDAFVKTESLVKNYPDDKESRTFYAIMTNLFVRDTAKAFAHLDTALQLDPNYMLALSQYCQIYMGLELYDRAEEFAKRNLKLHPNSPTPYIYLGTIYGQMNRYDEAIKVYEELLVLFPGRSFALNLLNRMYNLQRDFEKARISLNKIAQFHGNDPHKMRDYYNGLANLDNWEGNFQKMMDNRFRALREVLKTGDSTKISGAYELIASYYLDFEAFDSSLYYSRLGNKWATVFQMIDFPMTMVTIDPALADSARSRFKPGMKEFRSRLPSEFWPLADGLEEVFEAKIATDTAREITALEMIYKTNPSGNEGTLRTIAFFSALSGRFERAREILLPYSNGEELSSSGYHYPRTMYHLGIANEGLGNITEAISNYEEMLKYWGKPEIELKIIRDARKRLARLTM